MVDPVGWAWLDGAAAPTTPDGDPAAAFARCFAGPDGQRVLGVLKALTLERTLGPDAPEAALRHLEGQRQLVATILGLVVRGRSRPPPAGGRDPARAGG